VSRLLALSLTLLLVACGAGSQSGKKGASADSEFKSWGSDKSESSAKAGDEDKDEDKVPDASSSKGAKQDKLPAGPSCLDDKGDVQECLHDSDCCKGFYCGIDPTGSPRIKVCLYGGK
jgi:hypothetical protein